jgi:hypothetical protein
MADFVGGLNSASDYINNTNVAVPTNITGDLGTGTISAQMQSFSLKEIVCGILAGNGFKLPNIQLCLKINLSRLLGGIGNAILDQFRSVLEAVDKALDAFIEHTGIDALLGRLNNAIADFAAIANMINFCGTPVVPRAIPNVLADMAGSFTGPGKDLLDKLGSISDSDIGGCIGTSGGVNFGIFQGGALKDIGDLLSDFEINPLGDFTARINSIKSDLNGFVSDIENLIEFENNFASTEPNAKGGSTFAPTNRVHTGVGAAISPDINFAQASALANSLKSTYAQLSQYAIDEDGNNIFHYFLEPELIAKLEAESSADPVLTEQTPVYDYCGKVVGYTTTLVAGNISSSSGQPAASTTQPGAVAIKESGIVLTPQNEPRNLTNTGPVQTDYPDTPVGRQGDKKGDLASDGRYMYYCVADYDGENNIWTRTILDSNW